MTFSRIRKSNLAFKIVLAIAFLIVGCSASVFYKKMNQLDQSVELIAISNQTQLRLEQMMSVIGNYETSLRSYIITHDESYLEKKLLDRGEIELEFKKLKTLAANSPEVSRDLVKLKQMFEHRFELFRKTLIAAKSKSTTATELNANLLAGSDYTKLMRAYVYRTISEEDEKLQTLRDKHQVELKDSIITAIMLVVISLLILVLTYQRMYGNIQKLGKANDELRFLYYSFDNAEKLAGFGHWKYNLTTKVYNYSDNFYRLLGVEPQSFSATTENIARFIHPDDFEQAIKQHRDSLKNLEPTSNVLRYVLDDGTLKYIHSVGSFMKNANGEMVKVGAHYDMTDQYLKTMALEANNLELKAINEELESFNNIVSHDLQEPLRKIQMFISRLEESEESALSASGKEYFSKIRSSANRMQALMIDLVNYTRTIKGDKTFIKTNLNTLLNQILDELSTNIEERNATIEVQQLPTIKAIPFQIEQLFINLISNSLKYCKENQPPLITISLDKIPVTEICQGIELSEKRYHKITVKDNGIGFKQEYADKIFHLFQRLETDSKYAGTGLGLAICKKIVENHKGCIQVFSQPGKGAAFSLYFPKN